MGDKKTAVFILGDSVSQSDGAILDVTDRVYIQNSIEAERDLYARLHRWDQDPGIIEIHVVMRSRSNDWVAVINRLSRAAIAIY